jgi:hypothetical protein
MVAGDVAVNVDVLVRVKVDKGRNEVGVIVELISTEGDVGIAGMFVCP